MTTTRPTPNFRELTKEIGARENTAGEPIQAVNDYPIDTTVAHQSQQSLKCRAVGRCAGIPVVIEAFGEQQPADGLLRSHVGLAQLELDLARGKVVAGRNRLSGVDDTADKPTAGQEEVR